MITLITGTPGAGKTLYAISKLLRELVGSTVPSIDPSGNPVEVPRVIYSNINGLLIDHVLINGSFDSGLASWQDWAPPGAVICYDEVQREWPPRPNGSKIPDWISSLETHRHKGVDFIILTQHPMLLDQNVRALVGRHIHVRRMGGASFALTYEWDTCSRALLYSKALNKTPFRFDKSVFNLYRSAELHTPTKSRLPALLFVVLLAFLAAIFVIPTFVDRIASKSDTPVSGDGSPPAGISPLPGMAPLGSLRPPSSSSSNGRRYDATDYIPVYSDKPYTASAFDALRVVVAMPRVVGGFCQGISCTCYTQQSTVALRGDPCRVWLSDPPFDPYRLPPAPSSAGFPPPPGFAPAS